MMTTFNDWWQRRTRRQKKWLIVLAIILGLYGVYELDQLKYHPWRTWHPKYYVTIKGHVDPAIKDIVKLKWIAAYGSSIEACDREAGPYPFRESVGPRDVRIAYVPTIDASGNYEVKIPIDYYRPGYCHWQIYRIDSATDLYKNYTDDNTPIFLLFYPCGHSFGCEYSEMYPKTERQKQYRTTTVSNGIYQFDSNGILKFINATSSGALNDSNNPEAVPRNNNYLIVQNYLLKR